jgi:hypothetical protein
MSSRIMTYPTCNRLTETRWRRSANGPRALGRAAFSRGSAGTACGKENGLSSYFLGWTLNLHALTYVASTKEEGFPAGNASGRACRGTTRPLRDRDPGASISRDRNVLIQMCKAKRGLKYLYGIRRNRNINRHDRHIKLDRLADQHPVERVAV